jgi:hypothetical protein
MFHAFRQQLTKKRLEERLIFITVGFLSERGEQHKLNMIADHRSGMSTEVNALIPLRRAVDRRLRRG